jgi:hypothetical protein
MNSHFPLASVQEWSRSRRIGQEEEEDNRVSGRYSPKYQKEQSPCRNMAIDFANPVSTESTKKIANTESS